MATKYNKSLLEEIIKRDNCKIDFTKIDFSTSIKEKQIEYLCKCGNNNTKTTRNLYKYGGLCKKCINQIFAKKTNEKLKCSLKDFIIKAKGKHGDNYDYSDVEYVNNKIKIRIICKIHGIFEQRPNDHLNGHGCKECGKQKIIEAKLYDTRSFISKAKEKYGNKYDYSDVIYINCETNIKIRCTTCNKYFNTKPCYHLANKGGTCNYCNRQFSNSQINWLEFIMKYHNITIQYALNGGEFKIPNTNYKADGYCKETNTIYEFHGDYFHGNPKLYDKNEINKRTNSTFGDLYNKTLKREQYIRDMGYKLEIIWEYDWKKINKAVKTIQIKFKSLKCIK